MKQPKRFTYGLLLGFVLVLVVAWNVDHSMFNTSQFSATYPNVSLKGGLLTSNLTDQGGALTETNPSANTATFALAGNSGSGGLVVLFTSQPSGLNINQPTSLSGDLTLGGHNLASALNLNWTGLATGGSNLSTAYYGLMPVGGVTNPAGSRVAYLTDVGGGGIPLFTNSAGTLTPTTNAPVSITNKVLIGLVSGTVDTPTTSKTILGHGAMNYQYTNGTSTTVDSEDTLVGFDTGFSIPGTNNSFYTMVGSAVGGNIVAGSGGVFVGQKVAANATNSNSSVAIGAKSLGNCLYPARDTAGGYGSMQFSLGGDTNGPNTGGNRTAYGDSSGAFDDGQNNTWVGQGTGPQSHAAPQNIVGIGNNVLPAITSSATGGTVVGAQSGGSLQQFIGVLVGDHTLNSATGNFGVMVGDNSGQGLSFWSRSTGLGSSLASGWTGSPSGVILIGYGAGNGAINQSNNIAIMGNADPNAKITDFFWNAAQSTSASSYPVNVHGAGGNGSNVAGAGMGLFGGFGTGNANGGDLNLGVAIPGTSGSTANPTANDINISGANGTVTINSKIAGNGPGLTNLTYQYITNYPGAQSMTFGQSYWTNISADTTLQAFTLGSSGNAFYESLVLMVNNTDSAPHKITPPGGVMTEPSNVAGGVIWCTNGVVTEIDFAHYATRWTNAVVKQ